MNVSRLGITPHHKILKPNWMLAELTYACPLSCGYCSNPTDIGSAARKAELPTRVWKKCIVDGAKLGVSQIGFSGGEPLLRKDLEELVEVAVDNNLYTNLITSAVGLNAGRLVKLKDIGLDSIRLIELKVHLDLLLGNEFPLEKFAAIETLGDLAYRPCRDGFQ